MKGFKKFTQLKLISILSLLILCLTSCEKANGSDSEYKQINVRDTLNMSLSNDSMDISQSFFNTSNHFFTKGESGYYFLSDYVNYILYFDQGSHACVPLCGKADCKHSDNTCNAYLEKGKYLGNIYYYSGYVYLIKIKDGNAVLERLNSDGSERREMGVLCPSDENTMLSLVFHDSTVYIFNGRHDASTTENTESIRYLSLDGSSNGSIYEYTGTNINISNGKSYSDKLFFTMSTYSKDNNENYSVIGLGLFAYDYKTKNTEKIIDSSIYDYSIDVKNNQIYYYIIGEGLFKYDMNTKMNANIYKANDDTGFCAISYDGENLYMNNINWAGYQKGFNSKKNISQQCWIINNEGSIVNTINCDSVLTMYFGDQHILFASKINTTGANKMVYIDKKDLKNAKDWISLGSSIK